jgi:hypothetical protein
MQYSDDELIKEWEMVKSVSKILGSRERELNMVMMEKIRNSANNLKSEDKEIYVRQNSRTSYDLKTVHEAVPTEDFKDLVNLNKKAVETYINLNPAVKEKIAGTATTNYTSPFLSSRKIKK